VKLHKTQVAAEAVEGQGPVKVLKEIQTCKKQKIIHQYVCFCSATMLTSKTITESVENHSECCGWMNSCSKFVSTTVDHVNHEIPYDTVLKSYLSPLCMPVERTAEARPPLSSRH